MTLLMRSATVLSQLSLPRVVELVTQVRCSYVSTIAYNCLAKYCQDVGARVCLWSYLNVRMVKLTDIPEDPLACHLRHGIRRIEAKLAGEVDRATHMLKSLEPRRGFIVELVVFGEWDPLRVEDYTRRPTRDPIPAKYMRVRFLHASVQTRHEVQQWSIGAKHTDAEVKVPWKLGIVGHFSNFAHQLRYDSLVVKPESSHTVWAGSAFVREVVVLVAIDLDRVVRDDAEVSRTSAADGVEELWIRLLVDLPDLRFVVDHLLDTKNGFSRFFWRRKS